MLVKEFLRARGEHVHTVSADEPVPAAARVLSERPVGVLIVLGDDGRVQGILSKRDIAREVARDCQRLCTMKVRDLMSRDFVTCRPDDTAEAVTAMMAERHVRHLPVIEDGVLIELISIEDVLKHQFDACEIDSSALRNYVAGAGYY